MNLIEFKKKQADEYIKKNGLENSYISRSVLLQCKELLPEVKLVGKDENNNIIFFEETSGSLQKRHYGKSDKATSFNLLYNDGTKTEKVTKNYLLGKNIIFNEGYDMAQLHHFIENNNKCFNALEKKEKKIKCSFYLSEEEIDIVKDFVKKMREFRGE